MDIYGHKACLSDYFMYDEGSSFELMDCSRSCWFISKWWRFQSVWHGTVE